MIGLLIIFLLLVLIGLTKVGARVIYDGELQLHLVAGPFRISLLKKGKEKKEKKEKQEATGKKRSKKTQDAATMSQSVDPAEGKTKKKKKQKNPWVSALLAHWMDLLSLVGRVLRMPVVDEFLLRVSFCGKDPADTALNYGRACAAAGALLPVIENSARIHDPNVEIVYQEESDEMQIFVRAALTVQIYQIFALVFAALGLLFQIYQEKKQLEKAVQQ